MSEGIVGDLGINKEEVVLGTILFARIAKAIADTERVVWFELSTGSKEAVVHMHTAYGVVINTRQPRAQWRLALTTALDELDDIKQETVPTTDDKE